MPSESHRAEMAPEFGSEPRWRAARARGYWIASAALITAGALALVAFTVANDEPATDTSSGSEAQGAGATGAGGEGEAGATGDSTEELARYQAAAEDRLFSEDSFWNRPLSDDARLDPASDAMVSDLVAEVAREQQAGIGPWIQTGSYSTTIYKVGPDRPTVRVALDDAGLEYKRSLQAAFEEVPIPPGAQPADGEGHMTIWQPGTDRLWEFFQARRESDGWHAAFGGAIRNVSESPGYYTEDSWPGARHTWGATATSLPVAGGVMLIDELREGEIGHALAVNLPAPRAGVWSWPAQRSDGTGPPDAIPEGARLRLDPELDLDSLDLHPVVRMMAEAVQDHGMVVRDKTGEAIGFAAEDFAPFYEQSPYHDERGQGLFRGQIPTEFMDQFPWEHLQVLKLHLCSDHHTPCTR